MADTDEMEVNEDSTDSDSDESMDESKETPEEPIENDDRPNVYLPDQPLKEGEDLVCDQSAYIMLHQAQSGAPCLSFDIIQDSLGDDRETYPLTSYLVAGTQAAKTHTNSIIVMKMSNLHKTGQDEEDEEDDEESDDDDDTKPHMATIMIKHLGCVNRVRSTNLNDVTLAASWSELGRVNIWNLSQQLALLDNPAELAVYNKDNKGNSVLPVFTFSGHQQEGFGLDWSPMAPGVSIFTIINYMGYR